MSDPLWCYAKSKGADNRNIQTPSGLFQFLCVHYGLYNKISGIKEIKKILRSLRSYLNENGYIDRSVIISKTVESFDNRLKWDLDHIAFCRSKRFYQSQKWKHLRYRALERRNKCSACGKCPNKDGIVLHVDHVLPRSIYPEYALNINNLQVLCEECNLGKGNTGERRF